MVAKSKFKYGQLVEVHVPVLEQTKTDMLLKFNHRQYRVSGYKAFNSSYMYTLAGCHGKDRMPFWFAQEWLEAVE